VLLRSTRTGAVSIVVYPAQGEPIVNAMPVWGFGVTVPLSARVKPSSRLLAYSFGKVSGTSFSVSGNVVPADAPGSPVGGPGFPGMVGATWHGDQLVWTDGASLTYGVGADATRWVPGASFGEVSRDGSRLLAVLEQEPRQLVLQALAGPMPAQADPALGACAIPYEGTLGDVALAPSGRWVAFVDGRGLNLARAEVPGGGAPCALSGHRIVATNADDPAFSGYTFPAAAPGSAGRRAVHAIGLPAGSVALDVQPLPAPERIQSARGTRVPLLSITAETDSVEAVAIVGLGFELGGKDPGAQLLLVQDVDGDGVADPGEPVSAAIPAPLDGTPRVVRFQAGPVVPAGTRQTFLLMLELSGAAPNGARFSARYLPAETRTRGTISGAEDRFSGAASPVDSGEHVTTVLAAEERFNLSENPVRGASLTINYEERPRAAAVYTIAGQRVRDLGGVLGERSATWDLRNDRGSPVASGAYYLVIEMPGSRIVRKIFVVRP